MLTNCILLDHQFLTLGNIQCFRRNRSCSLLLENPIYLTAFIMAYEHFPEINWFNLIKGSSKKMYLYVAFTVSTLVMATQLCFKNTELSNLQSKKLPCVGIYFIFSVPKSWEAVRNKWICIMICKHCRTFFISALDSDTNVWCGDSKPLSALPARKELRLRWWWYGKKLWDLVVSKQ